MCLNYNIFKQVNETVCAALLRKVVVAKEPYYVNPELLHKISGILNDVNSGIKEKLNEVV